MEMLPLSYILNQYVIRIAPASSPQNRISSTVITTQAAQTDPQNTETTKAVLTVLVEAITQQASILELVESEVSDKVSSEEFRQVMGQKLSLR